MYWYGIGIIEIARKKNDIGMHIILNLLYIITVISCRMMDW